MTSEKITSFSNPKFKQLKSLAKSRNRKKDKLFLVEGRIELGIASQGGFKPVMIIYSESYVSIEEISGLFLLDGIPTHLFSKILFDELTYQNVPGNFLAVFESWEHSLEKLQLNQCLVILENIEKPGNLGAVLRTCDAVGVKNILVCESQIDLFNPNVIRNSRGALFTTNVVFCSNLDALEFCRKNKYSVYSAALHEESTAYDSMEKGERKALVFGAESRGLSSFWLMEEMNKIIIPMRGSVDSLNLSVSVAVLLYEATK